MLRAVRTSAVVRSGGVLVMLILLPVATGCGGGPGRVSVTVRARSPLADAPVRVTVRGLPSHGRATLRARWTAFGGHVWTSSTALRRTASGAVTLQGLDGMGFLWRMRPLGPAYEHPYFLPPASGPSSVALTVTVDGKAVAHASLSRRVTPPSVRARRLTKARDGVEGVLFSPSVTGRRAAVVVFGGSEGGNSMVDVAGLLAAHGYPTIALAYFGAPRLPSRLVNIPLEYFARAVRVLRRAPGVDPEHILVLGSSRGGELALLLASTFPHLIHGAIGLVPSDSVYPAPAANLHAWTLHGRPVPLEPIPVQRITGPVLTAGAGDDQVWPSKQSVIQVEHRLRAHHVHHAHEGLVYNAAGHLLAGALPYEPETTERAGFGGTPRADAAALADLWPHILGFLAGAGSH